MADAPATLEEQIGASIDKAQPKDEPKKEEKKDDTAGLKKSVDETEAGGVVEKEDKKVETDEEDDKEAVDDKAKADAKAEKKDEPDEEEDDDEITPEFKQALAKQRIDFKLLDGLTKKEKTVVLEQAKRLNQAFTRVQMEATSFRKEKATFETERTYQTKNPDRHIADLLAKEPELLEKVNKELERRQNPIYAEALEKDRAADRKNAEADALLSTTKAEELTERIATLEASTTKAAKEAGLPDEFAQEAVANAILRKRVAGGDADLTDAEISEIIVARTAIWKKHVGAHKAASTREANNRYVRDKAEDAKKTTPKPRGASTEKKSVPAGEKPTDVADFTSKWLQAQGM